MIQGPEMKSLYDRYVMCTYAPKLVLERGAGVHVWDTEGRRYLDFLAGIAVLNVGHSHPRVVAAVREQAGRLMHVSNLYYNTLQPQLARALVERSGLGGRAFFCNSGAEANEALIKLARLWGSARGRHKIVTMENSFHGRTLATLTATGQEKVRKGFAPLPAGFSHARFNDLESCRAAIDGETAAVLVEAIQGEGGILPAEPAFLQALRTLCDEQGVLLFFDEVQCGMGRTGHWFAFQAYGIEPDAFAVAKALAGGLPMGAMVTHRRCSEVFQPGHHATTFGGGPLVAAAALAVIETIEEEGLLANAQAMGRLLRQRLEDLSKEFPFVRGGRGMGLMTALVLDRPAADLASLLVDQGLLCIATGETAIRFLPPLTIGPEDIDAALEMIRAACRVWVETGAGAPNPGR